jgi:hypothetical protein
MPCVRTPQNAAKRENGDEQTGRRGTVGWLNESCSRTEEQDRDR